MPPDELKVPNSTTMDISVAAVKKRVCKPWLMSLLLIIKLVAPATSACASDSLPVRSQFWRMAYLMASLVLFVLLWWLSGPFGSMRIFQAGEVGCGRYYDGFHVLHLCFAYVGLVVQLFGICGRCFFG